MRNSRIPMALAVLAVAAVLLVLFLRLGGREPLALPSTGAGDARGVASRGGPAPRRDDAAAGSEARGEAVDLSGKRSAGDVSGTAPPQSSPSPGESEPTAATLARESADAPADDAADNAEGATVTGVVYGPDGASLSGVSVALARGESSIDSPLRIPPQNMAPQATARSGANGAFDFADVAPGRYWVAAQRVADSFEALEEGGFDVAVAKFPDPVAVEVVEGSDPATVALVFGQGVFIEGHVRTGLGDPVEGAQVDLLHGVRVSNEPVALVAETGTRTDADGYFMLPGLDPEKEYAGLMAQAEGYRVAHFARPSWLRNPHELILEPEFAVRFRATDAVTGAPVPEVEYRVVMRHTSPEQIRSAPQTLAKESERAASPEGRYGFALRTAGRYRLDVLQVLNGEAVSGRLGSASFDLPPAEGEGTELEVLIGGGGTVRGVVLAENPQDVSADGPPVPGATVTIQEPLDFDGERTGSAYSLPAVGTDAAGAFAIEGVPPGTWALWAEKDGLRPRQAVAAQVEADAETGELAAGSVTIRIYQPRRVFGRVTGPEEEGVAGARIEIEPPLMGPAFALSPAESAADGTYEIQLERGSGDFFMALSHREFGRHRRLVMMPPGRLDAEIDWRLGDAREVRVYVTRDGAAANLAGRSLRLITCVPPVRGAYELAWDAALGAFAGRVLPGEYAVRPDAPELYPGAYFDLTLTVSESDEQPVEATFDLSTTDVVALLEGFPEGAELLVGFQCFCSGSWLGADRTTARGGEVLLPSVPAGRYRFTAEVVGSPAMRATAEHTVTPGATDAVRLVYSPPREEPAE
ncbi:MAG: carboxypeptidase-like regulatory domain-containing protein [Candidatus Sumerlaeia bacterium]|nr:carboxypeptidase-like regulatory domain-containing protein [Candidatus Sumerlaeia bacterium]